MSRWHAVLCKPRREAVAEANLSNQGFDVYLPRMIGAVVIYESTVYPGATEEVCVPLLEKHSGLTFNRDFFAGYSPERINPGDKQHRLPGIKKVTSGSTPEIADFVDTLHRSIITAGTHALGKPGHVPYDVKSLLPKGAADGRL